MHSFATLGGELARLNITHQELADRTHYSRQSVSSWVQGRRTIPDDARRIIAGISPRLALEIASGGPENIFLNGWLDGYVDLSVISVSLKVYEELGEFLERMMSFDLLNKASRNDLNEGDLELMEIAIQEAFDILTVMPIWLIRIGEVYDVDLSKASKKHRRKLYFKNYKRKDVVNA